MRRFLNPKPFGWGRVDVFSQCLMISMEGVGVSRDGVSESSQPIIRIFLQFSDDPEAHFNILDFFFVCLQGGKAPEVIIPCAPSGSVF